MNRWHAALLLFAGLSGAAVAQTALAVARNADLSFGKIVAGASAGSVTIAPDGSRSSGGGTILGNATTAGAAQFTVTGDPLTSYSITLPASTTLSSNTGSLTVDTFKSSPEGVGTLDGQGQQTLSVGATVHVAGGQTTGSYSGSFTVLVSYN